jgi:hypothetical protein
LSTFVWSGNEHNPKIVKTHAVLAQKKLKKTGLFDVPVGESS